MTYTIASRIRTELVGYIIRIYHDTRYLNVKFEYFFFC